MKIRVADLRDGQYFRFLNGTTNCQVKDVFIDGRTVHLEYYASGSDFYEMFGVGFMVESSRGVNGGVYAWRSRDGSPGLNVHSSRYLKTRWDGHANPPDWYKNRW